MTTNRPSCVALAIISILTITGCHQAVPSTTTVIHEEKSTFANECINNAIAVDHALGTLRNHASEQASLSDAIRQYASGIAAINYAECPAPFVKAFLDHREAWLAILPVTEKYPDIRGELHELFDVIEAGEDREAFAPLLKAIWDTWRDVEMAMP